MEVGIMSNSEVAAKTSQSIDSKRMLHLFSNKNITITHFK